MPTNMALRRGINVGKCCIKMANLREGFASWRLEKVTAIQSPARYGNRGYTSLPGAVWKPRLHVIAERGMETAATNPSSS